MSLKLVDNMLDLVESYSASSSVTVRATWDEYFLLLAKLTSIRSTCLARPVGAVLVKDRQVLATGYNGPPPGASHCTTQGFCYEGLAVCSDSKALPSRAIHAEANAIANAAKHGVSVAGSTIYVTLQPCLSCLKLIIAAGIKEVVFETPISGADKCKARASLQTPEMPIIRGGKVRESVISQASLSMLSSDFRRNNMVSTRQSDKDSHISLNSSEYLSDDLPQKAHKVYISGPLTGVADVNTLKKFYESIAKVCSHALLEPYLPHHKTDPIAQPNVSPSEVFNTDKSAVLSSDLVIAYVGSPSLGVGMELSYAETNDIPVILLYEVDKKVSRFVRGMPNAIKQIAFNSESEALEKLQKVLCSLNNN